MWVLEKIGKGSYGTVFQSSGFGSNVALKIMTYDEDEFGQHFTHILRELWTSSSLHCGIKRLAVLRIDSEFLKTSGIGNGSGIGVALELGSCTLQSIYSRSKKCDTHIPHSILFDIFTKTLQKLATFHDKIGMHRDLKPSNILVRISKLNELEVDLIDFGMMTFREVSQDSIVTTAPWRAPEVFLNAKYTNKIDVWSLGVVFFELRTLEQFCPWKSGDSDNIQHIWDRLGKPRRNEISSFHNNNDNNYASLTLTDDGMIAKYPVLNALEASHAYNEQFDDFDYIIMSMLNLNPVERPSCHDILNYIRDSNLHFHPCTQDERNGFLNLLVTSKHDESAIHMFRSDALVYDTPPPSPTDSQSQSHLSANANELQFRSWFYDGILKIQKHNHLPREFVWNSLRLGDQLISSLKYTTPEYADIFCASVGYVCAAPFEEENRFDVARDFTKLFRRSKMCARCSRLVFVSIQDTPCEQCSMRYQPSLIQVRSCVLNDILGQVSFSLTKFDARPEISKLEEERFVKMTGWIKSF